MHRFSSLLLVSTLLLNTTFGANITKDCPSLSQFKNGEVEQLSAFKTKLSCNESYNLYGPQFIYCTDRGVWIPEVPSCIKSGCPNLTLNKNVRVSEGKPKGSIKRFFCDLNFILSGADRVLCDGTRWSGVSPNCVKYDISTSNFTCDFEDKGFCGWIQDINDNFDWTRWSGKTLSDQTGPSSDHTGNPNGHYIYIETTDRLRNDKAILMSPTFPPFNDTKFVEFWYHSFGRNVGALGVYVKPANSKRQVIFNNDGLNNDTWFHEFAEIPAQSFSYNILFEAKVGGGFGDIALDDINIYNYKVQTQPKKNSTTAKSTTTKAEPKTVKRTTAEPTTAESKIAESTTAERTTTESTTAEPTTEELTTAEPTTAEPAHTSASSTETATMEIIDSTDGIITLSLPTVTAINNITTTPMVTERTRDTLMVSTLKEEFFSFVGPGDDIVTDIFEPTYIETTGPDENPSSDNTPVPTPTMEVLKYSTENTNSEDTNTIVDNSKNSNKNENEALRSKSNEKPGRHPAYVAGLIGSVLALIIAVIVLVIGIRKWRKRLSSSAVKDVGENELNEILVNDSKPDTSPPPENPSNNGNGETTPKADLEATNNPKPDTSPPSENPSNKESGEKEEATSKSDKDLNNGNKERQFIDNLEDDNAKKSLVENTNEVFKTTSNEIVNDNITPDTEVKILESTTISANVEALLSSKSKDISDKESDKENKVKEKTDLTSTADGNVDNKKDEKKIDKTDPQNTKDKILLLETQKKSNDHKFSMFKKLFRKEDAKSANNKNPDLETEGTSNKFEQKEETSNTISVDEQVSSQQSTDVENVVVQKAEGKNEMFPKVEERNDKLASVEGQEFQLPKAEGQNVEMPKEEGQHVESSKSKIDKDNAQMTPIDKKANEKNLKKIKKERENEEKKRKKEEKKKKKEESKTKKDKSKKDVSKAKDKNGELKDVAKAKDKNEELKDVAKAKDENVELKDVAKAKDENGELKDVAKAKDEIKELQIESLVDKNIETKNVERNGLTAQKNSGPDDKCVEIQKEEQTEREADSSITLDKNYQLIGITTNLFDLINDFKDQLTPEITNQDDNLTPSEGASNAAPADADMTLTNNDTIVVRF